MFLTLLQAPDEMLPRIAHKDIGQLDFNLTPILDIDELACDLFKIDQFSKLAPILSSEKITRIMYHNLGVKIFTLATLANHTKMLTQIQALVTKEIHQELSNLALGKGGKQDCVEAI